MPCERLQEVLEGLEEAEAEGRNAYLLYVRNVMIETGGNIILPDDKTGWGPQEASIDLIGVFATGTDFDEAMRNWTRIAKARVLGDAA
ncbi:hypothetical protein AADZ90_021255 [Aestuariibius sp. 2305UL40-4]|uniref:hypothetical protein n=1 Tax=Aestuariibius violaceus TaxID=3234132 RepID=UPI00345E4E14